MNKGFKIMLAVGLAGVSLATTTVVVNTNSSNITVVQARETPARPTANIILKPLFIPEMSI